MYGSYTLPVQATRPLAAEGGTSAVLAGTVVTVAGLARGLPGSLSHRELAAAFAAGALVTAVAALTR